MKKSTAKVIKSLDANAVRFNLEQAASGVKHEEIIDGCRIVFYPNLISKKAEFTIYEDDGVYAYSYLNLDQALTAVRTAEDHNWLK